MICCPFRALPRKGARRCLRSGCCFKPVSGSFGSRQLKPTGACRKAQNRLKRTSQRKIRISALCRSFISTRNKRKQIRSCGALALQARRKTLPSLLPYTSSFTLFAHSIISFSGVSSLSPPLESNCTCISHLTSEPGQAFFISSMT